MARALVSSPRLLLMDEPLGALDKKLREQMQLEIKQLHGMLGMTVLYVTHDQEEALVMSDRICLMRAGRIEQLGTASDLYFRPRTVFAADFLGESNLLDGEEAGLGMGSIEAGPCKLLIRPENVRVLRDGETAPCMADAVLEDVIFAGGVTNLRARLAGGVLLVAKRLTEEAQLGLTQGASVRLGWSPSDVVVLR